MGICLHQINGSQYNVAFHIASTKNQQFNYSMNMQLLPRYKFQHSLSRTLNMYTVMSKLYRPTTNLDVDDVMASDCKAGLDCSSNFCRFLYRRRPSRFTRLCALFCLSVISFIGLHLFFHASLSFCR